MKRTVILFAALLASLPLLRPAEAQTVNEIIQRGELLVAIDLNNPPWGALDANQQPAGFDPALAKLVADTLGVKLRIERVTSATRIPVLLNGGADLIIATLTMTTDRAKQVWFTNPYAPTSLVLVAPAATSYKQYSDLVASTRIAVSRGTLIDQLVTQNVTNATIIRLDNDALAQQALFSGEADLVGTGSTTVPLLNRMKPGKNYEPKIVLRDLYLGMAVRPGSQDLLQWLNTFIFLHKRNSALEAMSQQHIGAGVGNLPVF